MIQLNYFKSPEGLKAEHLYEPTIDGFREQLSLLSFYNRTTVIHVLRKTFQPLLLKFLEQDFNGDIYLVCYFYEVSTTVLSRVTRIDAKEISIPMMGMRKPFNKQAFTDDTAEAIIDEMINSNNMYLFPVLIRNKYLLNHMVV